MARASNVVGRLLATILLARFLGVERFGSYIFILWLVEMSYLICSVGLAGAATRFYPQTIAQFDGPEKNFGNWYFWRALISLLLSACFSVFAVASFSGNAGLTLYSIIFIFSLVSSAYLLLVARSQGLFQFKYYAVASVVQNIITVLGVMVLGRAIKVHDFFLLAIASQLAAILILVRPIVVKSVHLQFLPFNKSKTFDVYSKNIWLTNIGSALLWSRGELPLVKSQYGDFFVGFYSVALTLSGLVNQAVNILTGALWPQIAKMWEVDRRELEKLFFATTSLLLFTASLAAAFLIIFSDYLILLIFGEQYGESINLVVLLSVGTLGLTSASGNMIMQASSNGAFSRNITFVGIFLLFTSVTVMMSLYGIQGAAAAKSATQIILSFFVFFALRKILTDVKGITRITLAFLFQVLSISVLAWLWIDGTIVMPASKVMVFTVFLITTITICNFSTKRGLMPAFRHLISHH